jgi:allantoinase
MSEPKGRGAAWTEERSDEGPPPQAAKAARRRLCDADMCAFAPEASFVVDAAALRHRNAMSAYDGKRLTGVVRRTWLRGRLVDDEPTGRLLRRAES